MSFVALPPDVCTRAQPPPIVVFLNKAGPTGRCLLSEEDMSAILQLGDLPPNVRVKLVTCDGASGAGVDEGLSWLGSNV